MVVGPFVGVRAFVANVMPFLCMLIENCILTTNLPCPSVHVVLGKWKGQGKVLGFQP